MMKNLYTLLIAVTIIMGLGACNKETATTQTEVMTKMLANKNWYLDYTIQGNSVKSYVGQTTYFVTYLKNGTTSDSDGLIGSYTVEMVNNKSQIHIQAKTTNGNAIEYIYDIISIGDKKMIISKADTSQSTPAKFYFTSN